MSCVIREAKDEDILAVQHFLSRAGVPDSTKKTEGRTFLIAEDTSGTIVATAALQRVTHSDALIRTLIIDSQKAGAAFILNMLESIMNYAWETNVETVYLMATKAGEMLATLGFTEVAETDISAEVLALEDIRKHLHKQMPVYKQINPGDK